MNAETAAEIVSRVDALEVPPSTASAALAAEIATLDARCDELAKLALDLARSDRPLREVTTLAANFESERKLIADRLAARRDQHARTRFADLTAAVAKADSASERAAAKAAKARDALIEKLAELLYAGDLRTAGSALDELERTVLRPPAVDKAGQEVAIASRAHDRLALAASELLRAFPELRT